LVFEFAGASVFVVTKVHPKYDTQVISNFDNISQGARESCRLGNALGDKLGDLLLIAAPPNKTYLLLFQALDIVLP